MMENFGIVTLEEGVLKIGNAQITRTWRVDREGLLYPLTLTAGQEWLASASMVPAPTPPGNRVAETRSLELTSEYVPSPVGETAFAVTLTARGEQQTLTYLFRVYADVAAVEVCLSSVGGGAVVEEATEVPTTQAATGVELADNAAKVKTVAPSRDVLENLALVPTHLRLTQVNFADRTDEHNELVWEREWLLHPCEREMSLEGCLFVVEETATGNGLIFLKHAPLPYARPVRNETDLRVRSKGREVQLQGHGIEPGDTEAGYTWATIAFTGGKAGSMVALQRYQRALRKYDATRDGLFLSNTWGDRNRDGRINEAFLLEEAQAGARLGVDIVQIDDGWEQGTTSNSVDAKVKGGVWEGFHQFDPDFWAVNPERFPRGLSPLAEAVKARGMNFGLWFGPDSTDDFANWERDAETVLAFHREHGVCHIKIDGVKLRTKIGERNLNRFFNRVLEESEGRVVFDGDVTAETRPGYFGMMQIGPLFVENRYTDWHRYWPHFTLRNLWMLAQYVDPIRLRMEFLNHARNTEQYTNDPLAPEAFTPDYLFATVMFGSPLGWFEVSNLPQEYFRTVPPLVAVWKAHRERLFGGSVLPILDAPDGYAWTGFASLGTDGSGYLLVFRELSGETERVVTLPEFAGTVGAVAVLAGQGNAQNAGERSVKVRIPYERNFVFVRWEKG